MPRPAEGALPRPHRWIWGIVWQGKSEQGEKDKGEGDEGERDGVSPPDL